MYKQKCGIVFITLLLSLLFLAMAIGYILSYSPGVFPDEFAHMAYVANVMDRGFPNYSSGTILPGGKLNYLNHPALYYLIVGGLANFLDLQGMYAMIGRYVNMLISILIIILTCRMLYSATKSKLSTFCGGAFLLVVPMFVVSGSAVSNDQINVLGCTLVLHGLLDIIETHKDNKSITYSVITICIGGIIAALSKATGSLAIVCLLISVCLFNFSKLSEVIKKITFKQWVIIISSLAIIAIYYLNIYVVYGRFYPAPQGNPALWFAVDHPDAKRLGLTEFIVNFYQANLVTLTIPYGHAAISDNDIRIIVLKTILLMLVWMTIFVIVKKLSGTNSCFNLTFSFVIAFACFIITYLFTIRQLHINTGYLGAMQARYFFGFLPVFSLVIAKIIAIINSKAVRVILFSLIVSGLLTALYPPLIKLSELRAWKSLTIVEQPLYNTAYGYLTKGRRFEQVIEADSSTLIGVELMLGTFARRNYGVLTLELSDQAGKVIASNTVRLETLKDNKYAWFDFHQATLTKNHKYNLILKCDECTQDNAITWWAVKKEYESTIFLLTKFGPGVGSIYPKGNAYVDGKDVGGAFAFRLYF